MIEMGKKYKTRNGLPVRILCNDIKCVTYTVIAAVYEQETGCESTMSVTNTGSYIEGEESPLDLIEVTPYEDFKEDDLCVIWSDDKEIEEFRCFAYAKDNRAYFFADGKTSFTATPLQKVCWSNCRKATEEEIRTKTIKD